MLEDVTEPVFLNESNTQITYKHTNGDSEYVGDKTYYKYGMYIMINVQENEYEFNQIKCKLCRNGSLGNVYVSIYLKSGNITTGITPSSLTLAIPEVTVANIDAVSNVTRTINLPQTISVSNTQSVLVCFYTKEAEKVGMRIWTSDATNRLRLLFSTSTNYLGILDQSWSLAGTSFSSVPLIALMNRDYATKEYVDSITPIPYTKLSFTKSINVAQGRELNIWKALSKQTLLFTSTVGEHRERCYRLAASTVANTALSVIETGVNKSYSSVLTLKVVSSSTAVTGKQILVIGDSLIAANTIVNELSTLLGNNGTNLFLGTQGTPTHHEGRSGWTFSGFTTSNGGQNPFWDGTKVNFKNYMSVNNNFGGTDNIDICYIQLGINDVYGNTSLSTIIANAKILIAALRSDYPSCKIILGIPPISCSTQDGFGKNYGAATNMLTYENNMKEYWSEAILQYDEARYNAAVTVCQSGLWVDRDYGYPKETVNVSARDSADQVSVFSNALHPNTSGYTQIADAVYSHIL